MTAVGPPPLENKSEVNLGCSEFLNLLQFDPPPNTNRTNVMACHLLVKVLWVTKGFTHFTS